MAAHSHDHAHEAGPGHASGGHHHRAAGANLRFAFFLNLAFALVELAGGAFTNSVAILSDAVHDFGDALSLGIAWYLERVSRRESDHRFSFGYRRFSVFGALATSVVLLAGSVAILTEAIPRLANPVRPHAPGMLALALLGIAVNGAAAFRMRAGASLSERVVSIHLLEDVLGWIAVLVVGGVLLFADLPILDPILSIGITAWVLVNVGRNLARMAPILLQAAPESVSLKEIEEKIRALPGVRSIHHTHLWSLDGERNVLTTHVVLGREAAREDQLALKRSIKAIGADAAAAHMTVEIELEGEDCSQERSGC